MVASRNWYTHQLDVHNAFFRRTLQEEVYMTPPLDLRLHGENLVCRLHKSIYGLKKHHEIRSQLLQLWLNLLVTYNQRQIIHFLLNLKVKSLLLSSFTR